MTTARELLSLLQERGVDLWVEGDEIRFRAPKGALTAELRQQFSMCRDDVRALLINGDNDPLRAAQGGDAATNRPLRSVRGGERFLSPYQERIWFLDQLEPDSATYNINVTLRMTGRLDVPALLQALNSVVARHEVLRTTCETFDGRPRLVVSPELRLDVPIVDLRAFATNEREAEAQKLCEADARRPFRLATGPLFRAILLQTGHDEHRLCISTHHFVLDGVSIRLLFQEVAAHYAASTRGERAQLPELPLEYSDFAAWQRQELDGAAFRRQLDYWKQVLDGAPAALELPTDRPRPAMQSNRGALATFELSEELCDKLQTLSRREGVTLFTTLLAAFQTLLSRYSRQSDVVVGTAVSNRSRAELESLIGPFTNTLALRIDSSGDLTFRELLRRVRDVALDAWSNQDLPFDKLVEELRPKRDPSRSVLFQAMFVLHQNTLSETLSLPGVALDRIYTDLGTARGDLGLEMTYGNRRLVGLLEYNTDIFESDTIARMIGHFGALLEGAATVPETRVSQLPLMTPAERDMLLGDWSQSAHDCLPADLTVPQRFEEQTARTPEATALVFHDLAAPHSTMRMTYAELNARANQVARRLRRLGVGPEARVALCVNRTPEMVVGILGIWKAGGVFLPLDPEYPQARLSLLLADAQVTAVVTDSRVAERLPAHGAAMLWFDDDAELLAAESTDNLEHTATAENAAYVIYTSGSTGTPKGVVVEHGSLTSYCVAMARYFGLTARDCMLQFFSISFDPSLEQIFEPLIVGGSVAIRGDDIWQPQEFSRHIEKLGVTVAELTPAYWHPLMRHWQEHPEDSPGATLRTIVVGGDFIAPESIRALASSPLKDIRFINVYGPTECTIGAAAFEVSANYDKALGGDRMPIGRPVAGRRSYILDPCGKPVPVGVPGELYLGGAGVARGYLNRPELTAERFVLDPFSHERGARMYRTGDLAKWRADGLIEMLGRVDYQVKIRGFRIELGEVEAALARQPGVAEAVVVAHGGPTEDKRLVAYIVFRPGAAMPVGNIRAVLQRELAEHMIPSAFVVLDRLPLSPNGKLDRVALPEPETLRPEWFRPYEQPRTPIEESVAVTMAEVLSVDRVGVHDNFFELGGHSLRAMKVVSRLREEFDADLPLRAMFDHPTVEGLALAILDLLASRITEDTLDDVLLKLKQ